MLMTSERPASPSRQTAISSATGKDNPELRQYYDNVAEKSPEARSLMLRVEGIANQMVKAQGLHDDAYRELNKEITYSVVVAATRSSEVPGKMR